MPVICWGPLAKSASDPTTIPEYISSKILNHNVDPSAHGLDNYALFNHRADEGLDHPDNSVTMQKLNVNKFVLWTQFESIDGFLKKGNLDLDSVSALKLSTPSDDVVTYWAKIFRGDGNENAGQATASPELRTRMRLSNVADVDAYVICGNTDDATAFGFRIKNGVPFAIWHDPDENVHQVQLGEYNFAQHRTLEAFYRWPGYVTFNIDSRVQYNAYIVGGLNSFSNFIFYQLRNNSSAGRILYAQWLMYQQDNF